MVQFSRFASAELCIHSVIHTRKCVGFPIRTSRYHCFIASFSALFAGLHVLLRLSSPRHPPDALIYLTLSFEVPVDFVCLALTTRTNFRYLTLIQFTALLWIVPAFCVQEQLIQSSPKLLWLKYIYIYNQHCLCLLISASDLLKSDAIIFANKNRLFYLNPLLFAKALFINLYLNTILNIWWRQTGSNRWPPACKAGALPTELCPQYSSVWVFQTALSSLVGLGGLEPPTPRLSSVCSNQLSYKPGFSS